MSNAEKPREIWFNKKNVVLNSSPVKTKAYGTQYIEKSAYDAVVNERDEARKDYQCLMVEERRLLKQRMEFTEQLTEANDTIAQHRHEIDRLGKICNDKPLQAYCLRLERALAYAKRVLAEWSITQSRELERLEHGEC